MRLTAIVAPDCNVTSTAAGRSAKVKTTLTAYVLYTMLSLDYVVVELAPLR